MAQQNAKFEDDVVRICWGLLGFVKIVVVRGALPRDPDAQLQNFSWGLLANHKCDPSTQKTAGIMIPAPNFFCWDWVNIPAVDLV